MLVMDVGDEMCWWQLEDVGDGFLHFDHPLSFKDRYKIDEDYWWNVIVTTIQNPSYANDSVCSQPMFKIIQIKNVWSEWREHLQSSFWRRKLLEEAVGFQMDVEELLLSITRWIIKEGRVYCFYSAWRYLSISYLTSHDPGKITRPLEIALRPTYLWYWWYCSSFSNDIFKITSMEKHEATGRK